MITKLKNIGTVITGNTPKTSEEKNYATPDIPFVKPSDLCNETITLIDDTEFHISEYARDKARIVPVNSVFMTCIGIIGKVGINNCECAFNQQINVVVPNTKKCLCEYLAYALVNKKDIIQATANAPVVPILNKTQFENIEIDIPNLEKQKEVVAVLTKIDYLISTRKQQVLKLDELIKSRFIEMFGEIGTDIKGWGLTCLRDFCVINPKKNEDKRLCEDLIVSFVPMTFVSETGEIDTSETKSYNDVKTGFTYFAENDVLFAKITPCMENGKGAIAKGLLNKIGFGSTEFHVLRPINGISNPYWIYAVTAFSQFRIDASNNMTGSAGQRRVPASFLETYKVALPPIELQNQFATFVEQTDKLKFEAKQSLEKLEMLKKALMQEYFG